MAPSVASRDRTMCAPVGCGRIGRQASPRTNVQLALTAQDRIVDSTKTLTMRGYDATGTLTFDGTPATVTAGSISRTKGTI